MYVIKVDISNLKGEAGMKKKRWQATTCCRITAWRRRPTCSSANTHSQSLGQDSVSSTTWFGESHTTRNKPTNLL